LSNIRVPERLRSIHVPGALSGRVSFSNGLSAAGGLTLPYKLAVVAVMMLVAGGTLVTFGSAGAETASVTGVDGSTTTTTVAGSILPGTSEATPRVEGQVLPETTYDFTPDTSILSADDLLASLKLTDYSTDADDKSDDDKSDDDDDKKNDDKKSSTSKSNTKSGTKTGTKTPTKTDDGKKDDDKSDGGSSDNGSGDGDGGSSDNGSDDGDDDDKSDDDRKCKDAKSSLVKALCK
jgi:hypothetical protein